jgi:hypothetical protein
MKSFTTDFGILLLRILKYVFHVLVILLSILGAVHSKNVKLLNAI